MILFLFYETWGGKNPCIWTIMPMKQFCQFWVYFFKTPYMIRTHNALIFLPIFVFKPKLFLNYISTKSEFQNHQTYLGVNFKMNLFDSFLAQLPASRAFLWNSTGVNRVARKHLLWWKRSICFTFSGFCVFFTLLLSGSGEIYKTIWV